MATGKIQRIATSVGALTIATLIGGTISLASNVLMAKFFGAGHLTDAFFMAYAIPLLFAKVFQAGPMPKVFLSLFVREVETQERESAWRAASNIFNVFAVFFVAIVGLLVLCAPWLVGVLAAGYESATFAETVTLARVVIPVLGLLTLSALLTAALQSLDEFVRPALFSLALPSTFLVAIVLGYYTGMGIIALPLGLLAGNVIQLGGLYWCLAHKGFRHAWV
ncbi:MAG: lipid II flippase MurJ, partial [Nitrospinota bacterium]